MSKSSNMLKSKNALPPFCFKSFLALLFERAAGNLSDADLQWLKSGVLEMSASLSEQSHALLEGLGALAAADVHAQPSVGSFQYGDSLQRLLFFLSNQSDLLAALLNLQFAADDLASAGAGSSPA